MMVNLESNPNWLKINCSHQGIKFKSKTNSEQTNPAKTIMINSEVTFSLDEISNTSKQQTEAPFNGVAIYRTV